MDQKKSLFMPAPRPASRISPEEAKRLVDGSADLGFDRLSGGPARGSPLDVFPPSETIKHQALSLPETATAAGRNEPTRLTAKGDEKPHRADRSKALRPATDSTLGVFAQTLRVDVPDELWMALKMASIQRKTSVKFLMLEALGKAGYPINLEAIPEDGRRLR